MVDPLFVVSAPRSGSTYLAQALGAHPEISMTNESGWVAALRKAEALSTTGAMQPIDDGEGFTSVGLVPDRYLPAMQAAFAAAAPVFVAAFHRAVGASGRYVGDKIHSHNDVGFLLRTFPGVRLVYLVRDLRDVLVSSYTFQQQQPTAWQDASFRERCEHLATFAARLGELLQGRDVSVVRYEELVAAPQATLGAILEWLGLDLAPAVRDWLEVDARRLFEGHGTSATPESSVGRWRSLLSAEQRSIIETTLGEVLRAQGYA